MVRFDEKGKVISWSDDECYRCGKKLDETTVFVPFLHRVEGVHSRCVKPGQKFQTSLKLAEDTKYGKIGQGKWLTKGEKNL